MDNFNLPYWNSKHSVEWAFNRAREDKSRTWREVIEEWEDKENKN